MLKTIAKHLNPDNLNPKKIKIHKDIDTFCAFTGEKITEGVLMKDLIKDTFAQIDIIKVKSDYASLDVALCIEEIIPRPSGKGFGSLRNYNIFASENQFKILAQSEVLDILLHIPESPFCLCVTFSNKKHYFFHIEENYDTHHFTVATDAGKIKIDLDEVNTYLPIIQSWYTIVKGDEAKAQPSTYFTKDEIKGIFPNPSKLSRYGFEKFEAESKFLDRYRHTQAFELIVHLLNRNYANQNNTI